MRKVFIILFLFIAASCLELPKKSSQPYSLDYGNGSGVGSGGAGTGTGGVQGLDYSGFPPINILCTREQVPEVCANLLVIDTSNPPASGKPVYVIWNSNRLCSENDNNVYAQGVSQLLTINNAGQSVTLAADLFNYQNGVIGLTFGSYAMWLGIDSNGTIGIQPGEAVHCLVVDVSSELGAIARLTGWREATATDEALFSSVGY